MIQRAILVLIFTTLCLGAPVFAQLGHVSGTVTDEQGNPVKDVIIKIEGLDVKRNYQVKTKDNGKYLHAGVALQGTYRVIAEKEGYQTDYVQGIRPSFGSGDDRGVVDFVLKKGTAGRLAFDMTDEEKERMRKQAEEEERRAQAFAAMKVDFTKGVELYNQGSYEEALPVFLKVSEQGKDQPAIWAYLGNTYGKMQRYDEGIAAYEKAVELSPDDAGLYQNLGNLYASSGNSEKAAELYEQAAAISAAIDPSAAAGTYYNMGVTYINSGKNQEAAEALEKALEADPNHAEAHYQLGITLLGLNRLPEAVEHLQKYLELDPNGPNVDTAKALVEQLKQ